MLDLFLKNELFLDLVLFLKSQNILSYFFIFFIGITIGSFLNVVIYRLPIMMNREYIKEIKEITNLDDKTLTSKMKKNEKDYYFNILKFEKLNLFFPRSRCNHCQYFFPIWYNIPLFSYLQLGGKCKNCKKPYSVRYFFVELFVGLFWIFSYYKFGFTSEFIVFPTLFTALIASAFIDAEYEILPDSITFGSLFLGLMYNILSSSPIVSAQSSILGVVGGYLAIYIFIKSYEKIRNKEVMGNGDIKLYAMCGAWIGSFDLFILVFVSSVMGLISFILFSIISGENKELKNLKMPFGPTIILSLFIFIYFKDNLNILKEIMF